MKRILPCFAVLTLGAYAFACSSSSSDAPASPSDTADGGPGQTNAPGTLSTDDSGSPIATPEELTINPTTDVAAVTPILEAGQFTDGPVWHPTLKVLFFTTPLGEGALYRMLPDGRVLKIRDGISAAGTTPIGNAVLPSGELVTAATKRLVRMPAEGGEPTLIAASWSGGAPPPPGDGGVAQGDGTFDTLNDVVARKDGTLYVTDPGYFAAPIANRVYRVDPAGNVQVVETFADVPRPNGIALSPDEKTLYVGFAAPITGTLPFVRKYIVNDDGTLGEWAKFVDVGPEDSQPDGITVDRAGNVYIATKAGIEVHKVSGELWGTIPVPEKPTGLTFGGDDLKTLYVTTEGVKIWQTKVKIAGF